MATSPLAKALARTNRTLHRAEDAVLALLLGATIVLASLQILLRGIFGTGIGWVDPLVRVLVLWLGLLGALAILGLLLQPPGTEEVCQRAGLTPLGEFLIEQMMQRGMILELDHMPRRSYKRAFEMLEEHDYPAAGTHGSNNFGKLYALGGVSKSGFRRCRADGVSASVDDGYQARIDLIEANAGYPAEGFGFDLNGFAGGPGPRFGPENVCGDVLQLDPVTYPFQSYAGDITFPQPRLGSRDADFNTEGMAHIGLLPELIEDIRGDGVSDEELAPLFHSAEGYVRMWEKSERRALDLRR